MVNKIKNKIDVYDILQDLKDHYVAYLEDEWSVKLSFPDFKEEADRVLKDVDRVSFLNDKEQMNVVIQFANKHKLVFEWDNYLKIYHLVKRATKYEYGRGAYR